MATKKAKLNPIDSAKIQQRIERYRKLKPVIEAKELFMIALCTFPYGFVVNTILVPHAIVGGGLTGLCEIIYFFSGTAIPIWLSSLTVNALLLVIAIKLVGWKFCVRTIYGVFCLTAWFRLIPISETPLLSDPFMAVILGGLFNGCGLGIVFLNNGSTGGTDIVAMIVNKFKHMPMGRVLLACDLFVISAAYFLPEVHSVEKILFGLCYTFMATTAVDWIMNRTRQSVQFFIFSKYAREIADAIITKVPRGVTIIDGQGGYSKEPIQIVTCLARKQEAGKIFRLVREIDPSAFVSESQTEGVFGQGFEAMSEKA